MAVKKMSIPAIAWRGDWRENRGGRDMHKLNLDARKDRGVIPPITATSLRQVALQRAGKTFLRYGVMMMEGSP